MGGRNVVGERRIQPTDSTSDLGGFEAMGEEWLARLVEDKGRTATATHIFRSWYLTNQNISGAKVISNYLY